MAPARRRLSSLDREILGLAVPALGALAAEPLYVLVDTAVVGHLGTPQLGGVAVAGAVLTTSLWLFNFLAFGTTAAVARLRGAGDERGAVAEGVGAMGLALVLGALLATAGVLGAPAAVRLMGASGAVLPHAETYLRISALGAPAVLVGLAGMGYLRGRRDTRTPLVIAVAANVVNLVLELVLIYGFGAGVAGSAWATVVAQTGAALVYVGFVGSGARRLAVPARLRISGLLAAARAGAPLFLRTGALLACLATATAVASRMGQAPLGAHQIAFQLWTFLALVLDAIAIAGQAMVGHLLGAGERHEARVAARRMIQWGVGLGLFALVAVAAGRGLLVHVFTGDPDVARLAGGVLLVVALMQPVNAVVFVLDGVLIGAGDARYLAKAMVAGFALFVPMATMVAVADLGLPGLWAALSLFMLARLAGNAGRFASERWQVTGALLTRGER